MGVALRARRNVDAFTGVDVKLLRRAFGQAMQVEGDDGYRHWAGIGGLPSPIYSQYGNRLFLPWNRAYLYGFEQMLRRLVPSANLPWWDWSAARSRESGVPAIYMELEVEGRPNPLYDFEIAIDQGSEKSSGIRRRTVREIGRIEMLPDEEATERAMSIEDFEEFSMQLERLHNVVHLWVGGTNAEVYFAPYDPFYWAYQAGVDRLWWQWQQDHPEAELPADLGEEVLQPFGMTVEDVWNAGDLGYVYADAGPSRFLIGANNDLPAASDELNFADYAQAFAEIVASPHTEPPLTIGIYGSWGIGKSTLLEMIADGLPEPEHPRSLPFWRIDRWSWWFDEDPNSESQEDRDTAETDVHVVRFNAWEHGSSEQIWPSLVRRIMEHLEDAAQWTAWERFIDMAKRNLRRNWRRHRSLISLAMFALVAGALVAWMLGVSPGAVLAVLAAIGAPGLVKLWVDAANHPVSRWVGSLVEGTGYGDEMPYMREIRDDLEFLTDKLQNGRSSIRGPNDRNDTGGHREQRILVMIDDLDRCAPDKAVEVLQAIHLLLGFPVFIVCLGIDARVITAAVEGYYEKLLGPAGASGYEYLDKIVQIPFRIPTASPGEVERFIKSQMPLQPSEDGGEPIIDDGPVNTGEVYPSPGDGESDDPPSGPYRGLGGDSVLPDSVSFTMFNPVEVACFQRLAPAVRRNPRHIKRLINVYRMVRTLATRRGEKVILNKPELAFAWILICSQWPYTASAMLASFKVVIDEVDFEGEGYPNKSPLRELYQRAQPTLDTGTQLRTDDDVADLERLLNDTDSQWAGEEIETQWSELRAIQPYTLNFNPAIEEALRASADEANPSSAG